VSSRVIRIPAALLAAVLAVALSCGCRHARPADSASQAPDPAGTVRLEGRILREPRLYHLRQGANLEALIHREFWYYFEKGSQIDMRITLIREAGEEKTRTVFDYASMTEQAREAVILRNGDVLRFENLKVW